MGFTLYVKGTVVSYHRTIEGVKASAVFYGQDSFILPHGKDV